MTATGLRIPRLGVAAVVRDPAGRVLVVQRAHAPQQGRWALPGGHVEWGETLADACRREVAEECGIRVEVEGPLYVAEIRDPEAGYHFVVIDMAAVWDGADPPPRAGSDAAALAWVGPDAVGRLPWATAMSGFWRDRRVREYLGWPPA
ncbi:NUDIX hydrolase [Candidatus Hydrogenisulfobacillus filiaventi]|uniref:NUDIX hydrolase n=1 Tax=Candidatus Hydrogenisulfobacillus filiaventi TaxID=2707344 RepID=A0A6F8ZGB6_9FIRM|nr:NUDIX domain-containing protein [Bacillota bacterium]CAB1128747.1 NUDIX hydrolase [Candidatus Hydrogenisulfobacillus filiaventi]